MTGKNTSKTPATYDPDTRGLAILIGVLFLAATVTFMAGDALIAAVFDASGSTAAGSDLSAGAGLISVCAFAVAAIGVAVYPVLRRYERGLALGYMILRVLEGLVILVVAGYLVTTGEMISYEASIYVFTGIGGLMLAIGLDRAGLIPSWLARLGVVGYAAITLAAPIDLLGIASLDSPAGMLLYVPGALFELVLPILLIVRGFRLVSEAGDDSHLPSRQGAA
jgi:hypothetical protein